MMRLPSIAHPLAFISDWAHLMPRPRRYSPVWRGIWFPSSAGIKHYTLALSKAYALLSLSYVLVWVASMLLPGLQGAFSLKAMLGVLCIMAG